MIENIGTTTHPQLAAPVTARPGGELLIDAGAAISAQVVDWNGDGYSDILVGSSTGSLMILLHQGQGQPPIYSKQQLGITCPNGTNATVLSSTGQFGCTPSATDWNNDGVMDVLYFGDLVSDDDIPSGLIVNINTGTPAAATFAPPVQVPLSGLSAPLRHVDLDGDGLRDIVGIGTHGGPAVATNVTSAGPTSFAFARPLRGGPINLAQKATMVLDAWDTSDGKRFHRRDLILGFADGTLGLMRDANNDGEPTLAAVDTILTSSGQPMTVPGAACVGVLERHGRDLPFIVVGSADGRIYRFARYLASDTPVVESAGVVATASGELSLNTPCPMGVRWDSDPWPDLLVGTGDGQVSVVRGTPDESIFEQPESLLDSPLQVQGPVIPRVVDWNDDGHRDVIVGAGDGYIYEIRNAATEMGTWLYSQPTKLELGGDKLHFTDGAAIEGFDLDGIDCAKDLRVLDGQGKLWGVHGEVHTASAPIPRYPLHATELAENGQEFHRGLARPRWTLPNDISGRSGRMRLELSRRADFTGGYEVVFLPDEGFSTTLPNELAQLPVIDVEQRRYWRLRWESETGMPGRWSSINSYSHPAPGLNPVDGESFTHADGRSRFAATSGTDYTHAKVADAGSPDVSDFQAFASLTELETEDGFRLRWQYDLDLIPLRGANHIALKLVAEGSGDEKFDAYAWTGDNWRHLTELPNEGLATVVADLSPADVHNGQVPILLEDRGADAIMSTIKIDQIALVDLNHAPVADAGSDVTVRSGDVVQLDASGSTDPDGDPLFYFWMQTAGTSAVIEHDNTATPTVIAPAVSGDEVLSFRVEVFDGSAITLDEVSVIVDNRDRAVASVTQNIPADRPIFATEGSTDNVVFDANIAFSGEITHVLRQATFELQGQAQLVESFHLVLRTDGEDQILGRGEISGSRMMFRGLSLAVAAVDQLQLVVLADASASQSKRGAGLILLLALLAWVGVTRPPRQRWIWLLPVLAIAVIPGGACTQASPGYKPPQSISISLRDPEALRFEDIETGVTAVLKGLPLAGPALNIGAEHQQDAESADTQP